jgi:hypothetical protein
MTRIQQTIPLAAILIAVAVVPPLTAQQSESLKGEVIAVQQQTRNQANDQLVTVRTRNGENRQLRLRDGSCDGSCVQVGDQIRARISRGNSGESGQVQSMQVRRNGEMFGYSNQSGQLVRTRQRLHDGSGAGQQARQQNGNRGSGSGRGNCDSGGGSRGGGGSNGGGR